jgi:G3E family GTPase
MSVDEFETSLSHAAPPDGWSRALQALWWDAHDDWERAHGLVQMDEADPQCAWVHAYLHRKEGDLPNAAYWYRRSGHPVVTGSLTEERQSIAGSLLDSSTSNT